MACAPTECGLDVFITSALQAGLAECNPSDTTAIANVLLTTWHSLSTEYSEQVCARAFAKAVVDGIPKVEPGQSISDPLHSCVYFTPLSRATIVGLGHGLEAVSALMGIYSSKTFSQGLCQAKAWLLWPMYSSMMAIDATNVALLARLTTGAILSRDWTAAVAIIEHLTHCNGLDQLLHIESIYRAACDASDRSGVPFEVTVRLDQLHASQCKIAQMVDNSDPTQSLSRMAALQERCKC
jgi:hypothetical protein